MVQLVSGHILKVIYYVFCAISHCGKHCKRRNIPGHTWHTTRNKKLHFTKRYLTALISKRLQLYEPQSPRYPISFDRTKWTRRSLSQHWLDHLDHWISGTCDSLKLWGYIKRQCLLPLPNDVGNWKGIIIAAGQFITVATLSKVWFWCKFNKRSFDCSWQILFILIGLTVFSRNRDSGTEGVKIEIWLLTLKAWYADHDDQSMFLKFLQGDHQPPEIPF